MSRKRDLANAAWGLEFGGSAVRLVRVARTDSGYRADQFVELPLAGRWLSAPDLAAAAASLRAGKVQEPLAASMPDELTLYRALSLPAVEPAALEMMVRRQVEAFVPGAEDDLFVWGSQSGSETPSSPDRSGATDRLEAAKRRVLVCAARRDTAEKLTKSCALLGDDSAMLVPSAMALARAYREFFPLDGRCVVLLDMAARSTTAVIVHAGGVLECAVMGQGGDHWTDVIADELGVAAEQAEKIKLAYLSQGAVPQTGGEALPECIARTQALWLRQLRELYQTCVEGMPQQDRPTEGVVFGQVGRAPGLAAAVGGASSRLPSQRGCRWPRAWDSNGPPQP